MKLAWMTDIHLNFLRPVEAHAFLDKLAGVHTDAFALTGDIGEADDVIEYLTALDTVVQRPVYFVLGNHDFYQGSIASVRSKVEQLCSVCPRLHWLPRASVVPLTEATGLVGHDGWGDGRLGNYWNSPVELSDWGLIDDFIGLDQRQRLVKLQSLGDEAAAHFRSVLPEALSRFRKIIVVTHVPPFRESCWYDGRISDDHWLPHFTCKAVGDVLYEAAKDHPTSQITVLCGHTHGEGDAQILPNLRVLTGHAKYGSPELQSVLEEI